MTRFQYFPHEVNTRNTSEVISLIEKEGMTGYGVYWAIWEYLRAQDDYIGDLRVLSSMARYLRTSKARLERIINNYGLFVTEGTKFYSPKLIELMEPLENKRKAMKWNSDE